MTRFCQFSRAYQRVLFLACLLVPQLVLATNAFKEESIIFDCKDPCLPRVISYNPDFSADRGLTNDGRVIATLGGINSRFSSIYSWQNGNVVDLAQNWPVDRAWTLGVNKKGNFVGTTYLESLYAFVSFSYINNVVEFDAQVVRVEIDDDGNVNYRIKEPSYADIGKENEILLSTRSFNQSLAPISPGNTSNLPSDPSFVLPAYSDIRVIDTNNTGLAVVVASGLQNGEAVSHIYRLQSGIYRYIDTGYSGKVNSKGEVAYAGYIPTTQGPSNLLKIWLPNPNYGLSAGAYALSSLVSNTLPFGLATQVFGFNDAGQILTNDRTAVSRQKGRQRTGLMLLTPTGYIPPIIKIKKPLLITTGADFGNSAENGDPVNTLTGEFLLRLPPDLTLDGALPLDFTRYYASNMNTIGIFGRNWKHNFDWTCNCSPDEATIVDHQARQTYFERNETTGKFEQSRGTGRRATLTDTSNQYIFSYADEDRYYFFSKTTGSLDMVEDRHGNRLSLTYDLNRKPVSISDNQQREFTLNYDQGNQLLSITDGVRTINYAYTNGQLSRVTDALGNITEYHYNLAGNLTQEVLPLGNAPFTQEYDAVNKVVKQIDALGNVELFDYSKEDKTVITRANGDVVTHLYKDGSLLGVEDNQGESSRSEYSDEGFRSSVSDAEGNTQSYERDPVSDRITASHWRDGSSNSFTYGQYLINGIVSDEVETITHRDGTTESFARDTRGRIITITDRQGGIATQTYASNGQVASFTTPAGGTIEYTYDTSGNLLTEKSSGGAMTRYVYDTLQRLIEVERPDGTSRLYTYDDNNNVTSIADENGDIRQFSFDANGRPARIESPLGNITTYSYDDLNRPVSFTRPNGNQFTLAYDSLGRVSQLTNGEGNITQLGYDGRNNLTQVTLPGGAVWQFIYNGNNQLIESRSPDNRSLSYQYDVMGRLIRRTDPEGGYTRYQYDTMDRLISAENQAGETRSYTYDTMGELSSVTLADQSSASYIRNELSRITSITDALGDIWRYSYDTSGRLISQTDPLNRTESLTYDDRNRPKEQQMADGTLLRLSYDNLNNVTRRDYGGQLLLDYQFDSDGREIATNDLTLSYDGNDNIIDSNGIENRYDNNDRLSKVIYAPGKEISYRYDLDDRLIEIQDWTNATTTFSYDEDGRLTTLTRGNGVRTDTTFDGHDLPIAIIEQKTDQISQILLTRNSVGRITAADRQNPSASVKPDNTFNTLAYDAARQIADMTYDQAGRLVDDGEREFTWDPASRLEAIRQGSQLYEYQYDGRGQLVQSTINGASTSRYVWNYALNLPSVGVIESGGQTRYYVHTPEGRLLYSIDNGGNHRYYHFDEVGNAIFLTDDSGQVTDSYAYSPFGSLVTKTGSTANPFTFNGQLGVIALTDDSLFHMRRRVYDSRTRRFLSKDIANGRIDPAALNPYTFAANNPLFFADPLGQDPVYAGSKVDQGVSAVNDSIEVARYVESKIDATVKKTVKGLAEARKLQGSTLTAASKMSRVKEALKFKKVPLDKLAGLDAGLTYLKTADLVKDVRNQGANKRQQTNGTYVAKIQRLNALVKQNIISQAQKETAALRSNRSYERDLNRITENVEDGIIRESAKGVVGEALGLHPELVPVKYALKGVGVL